MSDQPVSCSVLFAFVSAISFLAGEGLCKGEHTSDFSIQASRVEMVGSSGLLLGVGHEGLSGSFPLVFFDGKLDGERMDQFLLLGDSITPPNIQAKASSNNGSSQQSNQSGDGGDPDKIVFGELAEKFVHGWLIGVAIGAVFAALIGIWVGKKIVAMNSGVPEWVMEYGRRCGYANDQAEIQRKNKP